MTAGGEIAAPGATLAEVAETARAARRNRILDALFLCLALAALLKMAWIVAVVGANNPSNDYIGIVGIVDRVLSGTYDWRNLPGDSFLRTHAEFFPYLIHILVAQFFEWNMRVELFIGLLFHALRAVMLYDMLKDCIARRFRSLLLTGVFALVFSVTNASVFVYGETTLPIGLSLLGFTLGLWSIFKVPSLWAYAGVIGGGVLSSYSWGNAPTVWLVLFLCIIFSGRRDRFLGLLAAGCGMALSALPYLVNLVFNHSPTPHAAVHVGNVFQPIYIANALGRTFANNGGEQFYNIKAALWSGAIGIAVAIAMAVCLWSRYRDERQKLLPIAAVSSFGLMSIYLVSLVRPLIAAWYVALATMFWIGLLAAAVLMIQDNRRLMRWTGVMVLVLYTVLYLGSNDTLKDKAHFLQTRAYASESVLRNFRSAPTFCDELVFRWPMGQCGLLGAVARVLDRHMLGPCARHQMWYLQGDYPLGNVCIDSAPGSRRPRWIRAANPNKNSSWRDYELADLLIPPGNKVVWQCQVPRAVSRCTFTTDLLCGGRRIAVMKDLSANRGQTVSIVLPAGSTSSASSWLAKQDVICLAPRVEVALDASARPDADQNSRPGNVDRASYRDRRVLWQINLGDTDSAQWQTDGCLLRCKNFPVIEPGADLLLECQVTAGATVEKRIVTGQVQVNGAEWRDLPLPLMPDTNAHDYSYPLRLLELGDGDRLTGLRFKLPEDLPRHSVRVGSVQLMRLQ